MEGSDNTAQGAGDDHFCSSLLNLESDGTHSSPTYTQLGAQSTAGAQHDSHTEDTKPAVGNSPLMLKEPAHDGLTVTETLSSDPPGILDAHLDYAAGAGPESDAVLHTYVRPEEPPHTGDGEQTTATNGPRGIKVEEVNSDTDEDIVHETIAEGDDAKPVLVFPPPPPPPPRPLNPTEIYSRPGDVSAAFPKQGNDEAGGASPPKRILHSVASLIERTEEVPMFPRKRTNSEAEAAWVLTHLDGSDKRFKPDPSQGEGYGVGLLAEAAREEHTRLQGRVWGYGEPQHVSEFDASPTPPTRIGGTQGPSTLSHSHMEYTESTEEERLILDLLKYKCVHEGCTAAFPSAVGLRGHLSQHAAQRPYKCDHPGCSAAFLEADTLESHRSTHKKKRARKGSKKSVDSDGKNSRTAGVPRSMLARAASNSNSPPVVSIYASNFAVQDGSSDSETEPETWPNQKNQVEETEDEGFVPPQPTRITPKTKAAPTVLIDARPPPSRAAALAAASAISRTERMSEVESDSLEDDDEDGEEGEEDGGDEEDEEGNEPSGIKLKLKMSSGGGKNSHKKSHSKSSSTNTGGTGTKKNKRRTGPCKCVYPGCTSSFRYPSSLERHARVHTGERPYLCGVDGCQARFTQDTHMRKHQRNVHKKFLPS